MGLGITPDLNKALAALHMDDPNYGKTGHHDPRHGLDQPVRQQLLHHRLASTTWAASPAWAATSSIDEWDTTGYVQGDFNFDVAGVPVRGDLGVRYVQNPPEGPGLRRRASRSAA